MNSLTLPASPPILARRTRRDPSHLALGTEAKSDSMLAVLFRIIAKSYPCRILDRFIAGNR